MAEIEVTLNKLKDVNIEWVSLVRRGANQIPFRKLKAEDEDGLSWIEKLFKGDRHEEAKITSIIISKQYDLEKVKDTLDCLGFNELEVTEEGDGHVLKFEELNEDDTIFQFAEGAYFSVSGISKAFEPFADGTDFAENFKRGAFFPTVSMATAILRDTIVEIMFSADGGKPTSEIKQALKSFSDFIMASLAEVPASSFKLDNIELSLIDNEVLDEPTEDAMTTEEIKKEVKKFIDEFATTEQEQVLGKVKEAVKKITDHVDKTSAELKDMLSTMDGRIKSLEDSNKALAEQIEETKKLTDSNDKALKGMVPGGSADVDHDSTPVTKDDKELAEVQKKEEFWEDILPEFTLEEAQKE